MANIKRISSVIQTTLAKLPLTQRLAAILLCAAFLLALPFGGKLFGAVSRNLPTQIALNPAAARAMQQPGPTIGPTLSPSPTPTPAPTPPPVNLPSGYIPPACYPYTRSDLLVDCWLTNNRAIAFSMVWWFDYNSTPKAWPDWDAQAKQQLRVAFKHARTWLQSGMTNYPGALVQDPPPNLTDALLSAGQPAYKILSREDAWGLYLEHVGLSLAAEIYGVVPWSLRSYDTKSLDHLFNGYLSKTDNGFNRSKFWPSEFQAGDIYHGYINFEMTPTNATYTFKFLKDNNLLGPTPKETIVRVLQWSQQLAHIFGNFGSLNTYQYWQYWGGQTVSRTLAGTISTDPQADALGLQHWTGGCGGTSALLVWVLRAANIPAMKVDVGEHASIWFSHEKLFLSHGDDPYDRAAAGYPVAALLLNEPTFKSWFRNNVDPANPNKNVGRQVLELGIKYPGEGLVKAFCQDVQEGKSHAAGKVYSYYKDFYTVAQLEALGLWTTLAQKAQAAGACQP